MSATQINTNDKNKGNLPVEFKFEEFTFRAIPDDGCGSRFIANDACSMLELTNPRKAIANLDDDEKGVTTIQTNGGPQEVNVITESGLYNLIFLSRKPKAKAIRRWITHEVLPALRTTGRYELGQESEQAPLEFAEHCRRRFREIYGDDAVSPDHLLKILFNGNIPYTGDKRFRLLARESCEALGICNMDAALDRLPALAKGFVSIDGGGAYPARRHAITEAALYLLAFTPRDLSGPQLVQTQNGFIQVPNIIGKYVLTIPPEGQPHYYRVSDGFLDNEAKQLNALAACFQIKAIEACLYAVQHDLSLGEHPRNSPAFKNLEATILAAAQTADLQLAAASTA